MSKQFPSVYNLIDEDPVSRKYFNSLPTQVRTNIEDNARKITTFEAMKSYAQSIMKKS